MKKSLYILLVPILAFAACKNEKKDTPKQMMDEATSLPSMHVAGSDFSVDVPQGWTTKDTTMNGINIFFVIAPSAGTTGKTSINVVHESMQNMSPEQYKEATIASMKSGMPGFAINGDGEIEAGNIKGKWFGYKMNMGGGDLDAIIYTLPKDNIAYILTGVTQAGGMDKYKPSFDAIVQSFKLK